PAEGDEPAADHDLQEAPPVHRPSASGPPRAVLAASTVPAPYVSLRGTRAATGVGDRVAPVPWCGRFGLPVTRVPGARARSGVNTARRGASDVPPPRSGQGGRCASRLSPPLEPRRSPADAAALAARPPPGMRLASAPVQGSASRERPGEVTTM